MRENCLVFVGSLNREAPYFQGARGVGLSVYSFDETTLETRKLAETNDVDNPTFLSVTPDGSRIYANSEVFTWREGTVSAYSFDRASGTLIYLNKQPSLGSIAAHNTITRDGTKLLVANYGMGEGGPDRAVAVYGFEENGALSAPLASVSHEGSGPNVARQERSHAHSVTETIGGGTAIVADLGIDRLVSYRIEREGNLAKLTESALPSGAGPRHLALHPNGRFVFVMNELDSTIVSMTLDEATGKLSIIDAKPAVPAEARDSNHCADIQISPDGRFVYGSNRGHDSVVIMAVDQQTGSLSLVGYIPCGGATPRNLALTPSGGHLFSANQNGDRISIFARDADSGILTDTGRAIEIGTPMCVKIVR
ncbi:lactonase family protein [Mesorhizobium sp. M7A.F.Ca.US.001.01.1.1]|uniref:6-phosphogluconolactonase n=1 Tax=Mesorhizobium ciceri biovar biserrulae (strain HAMBI 2942 / LMG 23838 / WSM1271) TaxID=765698 RepID=E8TB93_MESCW|nr:MULTISPECIES: lactonase family protein [Mesorhizobium]ADV14362.1 6-phosphogluconolactonase [Mesorhizobium ciceri biovar biserrulae WSM1271]ARP66904.1 6-phosphogluconolactonase [Mesorhizobium sp. WSM1497]RVA55902.1 lactonase family protein [Mesorhizobium sp. M7A.F.Ca.US.001.01.1.1]